MKAKNMRDEHYMNDKPNDCHYCYFHAGRKGCSLSVDNCFYLKKPDESDVSPCCGCPYGRASPCIGFCMKKILEEMREKWKGRK